MENSQTGGKTWGIPFQRSTIVLYYNKELFKEAGLDPNRPPQNWREQVEYAQKLTKRDASGNVTQWGIQIPSSGFPYWLFQALAVQAGTNLMNQAGTQTYYDRPEVIEALTYWVDMVKKAKVHPRRHRRVGHDAEGLLREEGRDDVDDDRQPHQRQEQREVRLRRRDAARGQAARQPDRRRQLLPVQEVDARAARGRVQVHQWVTTPERAAQWGIDTGYVAVRADAWDTPAMKAYVAGFAPAAVARDQLPFAKAELSTHDNQRVTKALNDGLQAALTGTKTPEAAMKDAQREAERLLRTYK
jgi:sn-glycerol 3-phosphate transport system substrate-binding protein